MSSCSCEAALSRTYKTVCDGIVFGRTKLLQDPEDVARSDEKWVFLLRCRLCGTYWAEACWTSGMMDIYYIFPVPAGEEPLDWLQHRAQPLKWDERGPMGKAPPRQETA